MSIKSDRWIREQAEKYGMIEPFAPGQVRYDDNDNRIISYGTSSYGYDVRCSNEFKVFTNINSTIVDPKNLNPLFFISLLIASDSGDDAGISLNDRKELTIGFLSGKNERVYS